MCQRVRHLDPALHVQLAAALHFHLAVHKFYLNARTGLYKCHSANTCGLQGNALTFVRWVYDDRLAATTDRHYQELKLKRGLPLQTLKRHGLAWDAGNGCWLIPYKSAKGEVLNLLRYWTGDGRKYTLPALPLVPYGLDELKPAADKTLLVCEGAWDAIAADHHLREKKTRTRFDVLAVPAANVFQVGWLKHLEGYAGVRLCLDNDKAGRDGQDRIATLAREAKAGARLFALKWPPGSPDKCDVSDLVRDGRNVAAFTRDHCERVGVPERRIVFVRAGEIPEERVDWMWEGHVPFATFVSLSGLMGTQKSTVARDLAARGTAGRPMPNCAKAVPAFNVMYFTSEDSAARVRDSVRVHGGDLNRLLVHDVAAGGEPVDLLECLEEMEAEINARGVRLVVLDALNSFVGGDISTDSKARRTLSGRLQALARRTGACVVGIRNWGRADGGSGSQKALGATSLSDVARCVMNTLELPRDRKNKNAPRRFVLEFEKVSDAPKPRPIPYTVEDLSRGMKERSHLRRLVWGKPDPVKAVAVRMGPEKVAGKGSGGAPPHGGRREEGVGYV